MRVQSSRARRLWHEWSTARSRQFEPFAAVEPTHGAERTPMGRVATLHSPSSAHSTPSHFAPLRSAALWRTRSRGAARQVPQIIGDVSTAPPPRRWVEPIERHSRDGRGPRVAADRWPRSSRRRLGAEAQRASTQVRDQSLPRGRHRPRATASCERVTPLARPAGIDRCCHPAP